MTPKQFRRIRRQLGLSQVELARILGRSERSIRDYETVEGAIDECLELAMRYLREHQETTLASTSQ